MHCLFCGTENRVGAKFCGRCGKPLARERCHICQYQNPLDNRFCGSCGNLLSVDVTGAISSGEDWFQRVGRRRVFGYPIGANGAAVVLAILVLIAASAVLWMVIRYQQGRLL